MAVSRFDGFWPGMAPCEHFVQIYEREEDFMEALSAFTADGLAAGDSAIVIATPAHRSELDRRLAMMGIDIPAMKAEDRLISCDAKETLAAFTVDGWPQEERFREVIGGLVRRAAGDGRRVRAFGEMVALLWAKGYFGATMMLERLWTEMCKSEQFTLFCAYPKTTFALGPPESMSTVLEAHSRVLVS